MQRKVFLQFFLFTIILGSLVIFYNVYFVDKKLNIPSENTNDKIAQNSKDSNIIYNIEYVAKDKKGSSYLLQSNYGELNINQTNLITLEIVTAVINLENSPPININSDNALYNNTNHDTEFYGNVVVTYLEHIITSDNLNLYFEKDEADILNNVVYKNLNTTLEADKIKIDLLTKNSIIYMNNSFQKVKLTNKK
jgi:lipopolysaccharide export system protein LptA